MKAILVREFGGPDVLKLEDVPQPKPGAGQVLVRIEAAGVNPADTYQRSGNYAVTPPLPYTPGVDGAGVVESLGAGVTRMKPGDRVYLARTLSGTYAEYALALESQVHALPDRVSSVQGAGIFVPYATAYHALFGEVTARAGQTVLVHGASGGVGLAAVQIARAAGLTVFGTASSAKGLALATQEGAHAVFDHSKPDYQKDIVAATEGLGVDLILEMLANVNLGNDLKLIGQHGKIVVIGNRGDVTINARDLMGRRGAIHAFTLWGLTAAEEAAAHAALRAGFDNGTLRPVVAKTLPLKDACQAHIDVMAAGASGKIALVP